MTEASSSRAGRRPADRSDAAVGGDPFALLGLAPRPGLSDDDVRAAWRRIAAATHPDREDGGDPARFGAAAGAYVVLRTEFGRGEALADLGLSETTYQRGRHAHRHGRSADPLVQGTGRHRARREAPVGRPIPVRLPRLTRLQDWMTRRAATRDLASEAMVERASTRRPARLGLRRRPIRRPGGFALRLTAVAVVALIAVVISGWSPGVVGVLAGVLSWLLVTVGHAFARRRSQRPF
jgi:curved DNA-binding protein CbpA